MSCQVLNGQDAAWFLPPAFVNVPLFSCGVSTTPFNYYGISRPYVSQDASTARFQRAQPRKKKPSLLDAGTVRTGLFATLRHSRIPRTSMVYQQPHFNAGTDNHPVCVVGLKDQGEVACVLLVTSFGGAGIDHKYPDRNHLARRQYLAIQHGPVTKPVVEEQEVLQMTDGGMLKPSFVHLDDFLLIETQYLESWGGSGRCLSTESVTYLQSQMRDFVSGKIPRPVARRGCPRSPLEDGVYAPADLGLPLDASQFKVPPRKKRAIQIVAPSSPSSTSPPSPSPLSAGAAPFTRKELLTARTKPSYAVVVRG